MLEKQCHYLCLISMDLSAPIIVWARSWFNRALFLIATQAVFCVIDGKFTLDIIRHCGNQCLIAGFDLLFDCFNEERIEEHLSISKGFYNNVVF